jgi:lipopolysaccharide transport system permease protein
LWQYHELFQVLAWRDISVRYKQTVIGAAWALIRPFLTMVVFTAVFGKLAKLPSDGAVPYALMVFAGMLPWSFFATAVADASNSLTGNANLIGLPPVDCADRGGDGCLRGFPYRLCDPRGADGLVPVHAGLADLAVAGICGHCIRGQPRCRCVDHGAQRQVSGFPLRDSICRAVRSLCVSSRVQLQHHPRSVAARLFSQSDGRVIDGFRWCLLGGESQLYLPGFWLSLGVTSFFMWLGLRQFRKMEKSFADLM